MRDAHEDMVREIDHTATHQGIRDQVCSSCGTVLDYSMWCSKCNATAMPKKKPCEYCGEL